MKIQGIISIDCSWRGMGVVVYVPGIKKWSKVYDIKPNQKTYYKPKYTIPAVVGFVNELLEDQPLCHICDILIVESQYKTQMINLQIAVTSAIVQATGSKIYFFTPMAAKKAMGVLPQNSHYKNKTEMLKTVRDYPKSFICSSLHKNDHNLADSIALINAFYKKYKVIEIMSNENGATECPKCERDSVFKNTVKKNNKNFGRVFESCCVDDCKYFKWCTDEEETIPSVSQKKYLPKKRQRDEIKRTEYNEPPKKRIKKELTEEEMLVSVESVKVVLEDFSNRLIEHLGDMFAVWMEQTFDEKNEREQESQVQ